MEQKIDGPARLQHVYGPYTPWPGLALARLCAIDFLLSGVAPARLWAICLVHDFLRPGFSSSVGHRLPFARPRLLAIDSLPSEFSSSMTIDSLSPGMASAHLWTIDSLSPVLGSDRLGQIDYHSLGFSWSQVKGRLWPSPRLVSAHLWPSMDSDRLWTIDSLSPGLQHLWPSMDSARLTTIDSLWPGLASAHTQA